MRTLRTFSDLQKDDLVAPETLAELEPVLARYATAISLQVAELIDTRDETDPIARQYVPSVQELVRRDDELDDPIGDHTHEPVEGLVHRYPDRVLLKIVAVCPVYCRFCFRREMVGPGKNGNLTPDALATALEYIRAHPEIWEVILTGGDPFMLSTARAKAVTQELERITHVKVIRWHTRMPVADASRVSDEFVVAIRSSSKAVCVVLHANHVRELTVDARVAIARMVDAGIVVRSQSVLLKGVNDSIEALSDLMRGLVECRVQPYYLHHPDMAPGTSHFRISVAEGQALVRELRDRLSGICQPTYVIDIPGGVSKAVVAAPDIDGDSGDLRLRGRDGEWRDYPETD